MNCSVKFQGKYNNNSFAEMKRKKEIENVFYEYFVCDAQR